MKKKLLVLTVKFDTGGTEKVTFDIITHLNPDKYDITLMSMYGGGYYWDNLPKHIHRKYFFPKFIRYVIRYVTWFPGKLVYNTFIRDKYDVEIACGDDIPYFMLCIIASFLSKMIMLLAELRTKECVQFS